MRGTSPHMPNVTTALTSSPAPLPSRFQSSSSLLARGLHARCGIPRRIELGTFPLLPGWDDLLSQAA